MLDLESSQVTQDPYSAYRALREQGDVVYDTNRKTCYFGAYQASADILRNSRLFSNRNAGIETSLGGGDGRDHARVRKSLLPALASAQIASLENRISQLVGELAGRFAKSKSCEIIDAYAIPIPATVTSWLMGLPKAGPADIRRWSQVIMRPEVGGQCPVSRVQRAMRRLTGRRPRDRAQRIVDCQQMLRKHFERAAQKPTGGSVTDRIAAGWKQGELSEKELLDVGMLMLIAGTETTTNLIGNAILILAQDRQLQDRLRADAALLEPFIEEVLRFQAPVQRRVRLTTEPTEIGGHSLPKGTSIQLLIGSANRDPAIFSDPDQFRLDRAQNRHLSFAVGPHFCPGAQLARLEAVLATRTLLQRLGPFSLAGLTDPLCYVDNNRLRGLVSLRIAFD